MQSINEAVELINEQMIIEQFLDEMANLYQDDTGLPWAIWVGEVGGQHGPRVKVCNVPGRMRKDDCFVVAVDRHPRVLTPRHCKLNSSDQQLILDWVQLNYEILMKMWHVYETGDGSIIQLQNNLRKL